MFGPIGGLAGDLIVGPGQFLLAPWKHRLSWKTWRRIRHAGTIVAAGNPDLGDWPLVGQAMPNGFEVVPLGSKRWTADFVYIRPRWRDPGQGERAAEVARRMRDKRVGYSYATYVRLAAHRTPIPTPHLDRYVNRVDADGYPVQAICSQANDFILSESGGLTPDGKVFDDGRAHADVVPSELYLRLLQLDPVAVCKPGKLTRTAPGAARLGARAIPDDLL
jgi:hypothetical protein